MLSLKKMFVKGLGLRPLTKPLILLAFFNLYAILSGERLLINTYGKTNEQVSTATSVGRKDRQEP